MIDQLPVACDLKLREGLG